MCHTCAELGCPIELYTWTFLRGVLSGGPLVVGWGFQPGDPFEGAGTHIRDHNTSYVIIHTYNRSHQEKAELGGSGCPDFTSTGWD